MSPSSLLLIAGMARLASQRGAVSVGTRVLRLSDSIMRVHNCLPESVITLDKHVNAERV